MSGAARALPGLVVVLALAAAGCRSVEAEAPRGSARTCLTENAKFAEAWACIRGRLGSAAAGEARSHDFLVKGDSLAAAVEAGNMSSVEARNEVSADLRRDLGE